jgi:hypothetical protein
MGYDTDTARRGSSRLQNQPGEQGRDSSVVSGATRLVTKLGYRVLSIGLNPDVPRLKVGLWGTRATGKTTSLALLPTAAEGTSWTMEPIGVDASEFIERSQIALFVDGRFPEPSTELPPIPYTFLVRRPRAYLEKVVGRRRAFQVTFLDASGSWCERPIPARLAAPDSPIEYLATCDAIFFFLDSVRMRLTGSEYGASVVEVLDSLRRRLELTGNRPLPHYAAFIVPKADEDEQWAHRDRVEAHLMELLGMEPFHAMVERFQPSRYRVFACSAVGRNGSRSNCEHHDGLSRIGNPGSLRPHNLFEPLEWMLERLS